MARSTERAGWVSLVGGNRTERIEAFCDAVFAIAMTLLVIELHPPETPDGDDAALAAGLVQLAPSFIGFVVSFLVIGINWRLHHRKFQVIERWNERLLRNNLLLLLLIALLPFSTALASGAPGTSLALMLYAWHIAAVTAAQGLIWHQAAADGLVRSDVPKDVVRAVGLGGAGTLGAFVLAGGLAWIAPWLGWTAMALAAPAQWLVSRRLRRVDLERRYPPLEPGVEGASG